MYIFHPRARRAHRNCPTYIHPPIVGMIYPIPTYIVRRQILPKLLAAYIQYKSYNSKTYITQLCARRAQRNLSIYCESSNSVRQLSQSVCIGMTLSFGWLGSKRSNRVRHSNSVRHALQARRALGAEGHIRTACPRTACNNCPKVYV